MVASRHSCIQGTRIAAARTNSNAATNIAG
jgi:hypothetical protein